MTGEMRLLPGGYRASVAGYIAGRAARPLFCLAPHGVFRALPFAREAVSFYLAFSPLPRCRGGLFSVTLSVAVSFRRRCPRILRGVVPCGVRTFLWRAADPYKHPPPPAIVSRTEDDLTRSYRHAQARKTRPIDAAEPTRKTGRSSRGRCPPWRSSPPWSRAACPSQSAPPGRASVPRR